nr:MAG: coat protein [Guiyang partitivirus 1]
MSDSRNEMEETPNQHQFERLVATTQQNIISARNIETSALEGRYEPSNPTSYEEQIENEEEPKQRKTTINFSSCYTTFFDNFAIAEAVTRDIGNDFTIMVQPDFRFPTVTIIYEIIKSYHDINIKGTSYMSLYTYAAYCLTLIFAHILNIDIASTLTKSAQTHIWKTDPTRTNFLKHINNLLVPKFLLPLITNLIPLNDIKNNKIRFTPSLSGALFVHDYGRLITSRIFYTMHDVIATTRPTNDPRNTSLIFLNSNIITYNTQDYTVSHIIGGSYAHNNIHHEYHNWFCNTVLSLFTPITARNQIQRPTFARINTTPMNCNAQSINYYDYVLNFDADSVFTIQQVLTEIAAVIKSENLGSQNLLTIVDGVSNSSILTHTIEPLQMPTWHYYSRFPPSTTVDVPTPTTVTHAQAMTNGHLLNSLAAGAGTISAPTGLTHIPAGLNLFGPAQLGTDPKDLILPTDLSNPQLNCMLFQPYNTQIESAKPSLLNGLKIQHANIDGLVEVIPNPVLPVALTNSQHLIGAIPAQCIMPEIMRARTTNTTEHYRRAERFSSETPLGLILRNASRNELPYFDLNYVNELPKEVPGLTIVDNIRNFDLAGTYYLWTPSNNTSSTRRKYMLWSSYRYSPNLHIREPNVYMYYDLRGLFGTNINVAQIPLPHMLFKK